MKRHLTYAIPFALLLWNGSLSASTLQTLTYNFPLDVDGGGAEATLNGSNVEIFCDNFGNEISVPSGTYTANVTDLSTTANLDETRFGGVLSGDWVNINLSGGNPTATTDDTFFNTGAGSSSLARYEMVAYLVSLYNVPQGASTANNDLQYAIWSLMDPTADSMGINENKVTSDLEAAASWYMNMNTPGNLNALNSFLGEFEVVSDAKMTFSNGLGVGGFQEQIVWTPTPEPRLEGLALFGLFAAGAFLLRRFRAGQPRVHPASR